MSAAVEHSPSLRLHKTQSKPSSSSSSAAAEPPSSSSSDPWLDEDTPVVPIPAHRMTPVKPSIDQLKDMCAWRSPRKRAHPENVDSPLSTLLQMERSKHVPSPGSPLAPPVTLFELRSPDRRRHASPHPRAATTTTATSSSSSSSHTTASATSIQSTPRRSLHFKTGPSAPSDPSAPNDSESKDQEPPSGDATPTRRSKRVKPTSSPSPAAPSAPADPPAEPRDTPRTRSGRSPSKAQRTPPTPLLTPPSAGSESGRKSRATPDGQDKGAPFRQLSF